MQRAADQWLDAHEDEVDEPSAERLWSDAAVNALLDTLSQASLLHRVRRFHQSGTCLRYSCPLNSWSWDLALSAASRAAQCLLQWYPQFRMGLDFEAIKRVR